MAFPAPNCIINAQHVATHAHGRLGRAASCKSAFLNVLFADSSSAELANCSGFFFTLDTFHMRVPMPSNGPAQAGRADDR
jgi:hypothetical protein